MKAALHSMATQALWAKLHVVPSRKTSGIQQAAGQGHFKMEGLKIFPELKANLIVKTDNNHKWIEKMKSPMLSQWIEEFWNSLH